MPRKKGKSKKKPQKDTVGASAGAGIDVALGTVAKSLATLNCDVLLEKTAQLRRFLQSNYDAFSAQYDSVDFRSGMDPKCLDFMLKNADVMVMALGRLSATLEQEESFYNPDSRIAFANILLINIVKDKSKSGSVEMLKDMILVLNSLFNLFLLIKGDEITGLVFSKFQALFLAIFDLVAKFGSYTWQELKRVFVDSKFETRSGYGIHLNSFLFIEYMQYLAGCIDLESFKKLIYCGLAHIKHLEIKGDKVDGVSQSLQKAEKEYEDKSLNQFDLQTILEMHMDFSGNSDVVGRVQIFYFLMREAASSPSVSFDLNVAAMRTYSSDLFFDFSVGWQAYGEEVKSLFQWLHKWIAGVHLGEGGVSTDLHVHMLTADTADGDKPLFSLDLSSVKVLFGQYDELFEALKPYLHRLRELSSCKEFLHLKFETYQAVLLCFVKCMVLGFSGSRGDSIAELKRVDGKYIAAIPEVISVMPVLTQEELLTLEVIVNRTVTGSFADYESLKGSLVLGYLVGYLNLVGSGSVKPDRDPQFPGGVEPYVHMLSQCAVLIDKKMIGNSNQAELEAMISGYLKRATNNHGHLACVLAFVLFVGKSSQALHQYEVYRHVYQDIEVALPGCIVECDEKREAAEVAHQELLEAEEANRVLAAARLQSKVDAELRNIHSSKHVQAPAHVESDGDESESSSDDEEETYHDVELTPKPKSQEELKEELRVKVFNRVGIRSYKYDVSCRGRDRLIRKIEEVYSGDYVAKLTLLIDLKIAFCSIWVSRMPRYPVVYVDDVYGPRPITVLTQIFRAPEEAVSFLNRGIGSILKVASEAQLCELRTRLSTLVSLSALAASTLEHMANEHSRIVRGYKRCVGKKGLALPRKPLREQHPHSRAMHQLKVAKCIKAKDGDKSEWKADVEFCQRQIQLVSNRFGVDVSDPPGSLRPVGQAVSASGMHSGSIAGAGAGVAPDFEIGVVENDWASREFDRLMEAKFSDVPQLFWQGVTIHGGAIHDLLTGKSFDEINDLDLFYDGGITDFEEYYPAPKWKKTNKVYFQAACDVVQSDVKFEVCFPKAGVQAGYDYSHNGVYAKHINGHWVVKTYNHEVVAENYFNQEVNRISPRSMIEDPILMLRAIRAAVKGKTLSACVYTELDMASKHFLALIEAGNPKKMVYLARYIGHNPDVAKHELFTRFKLGLIIDGTRSDSSVATVLRRAVEGSGGGDVQDMEPDDVRKP